MDSGSGLESPVEEVVGSVGSGLVGLYLRVCALMRRTLPEEWGRSGGQ